jgi:hypothetical protein
MALFVKQKGLAGFVAKLRSATVAFDRQVLGEIGNFSVNRIQAFTRTGKSLPEEGAKFNELSESYKQFRRGKVTFWKNESGVTIAAPFRSNRLNKVDSSFFSPNRSNLTFTGEMIKSLKYKIDTGRNSVLIKPTGDRNEKVAGYVSGLRPWIGMDRVGRERIVNFVRRAIRERLKITK